jgi:hypothetical protein
MWGYGNSASLAQIPNYEEAKKRFDLTAPIRGRTEECRPLGKNRRYSHYTINKNMRAVEDGLLGKWVETYSAKVYNSDVLEWSPDGVLKISTGRWRGPIIQSVINYTICSSVGTIQSYNGKWYFHNGTGNAYFIPHEKEAGLDIQVENNAVLNPVQEFRRKAKRKELNAIRKRYAKFINYGSNMFRISNEYDKEMDRDKVCELIGVDRLNFTWHRWSEQKSEAEDNRNKLFSIIEEYENTNNLELAYNATIGIARSLSWWGHQCTPEEFENGFTEILKYKFREQVFESEPVQIGKAFYDRNAKFFI